MNRPLKVDWACRASNKCPYLSPTVLIVWC
uniref:Uncharacterized protein n=1 Tax=Anguilla anguilla TaxID=7936 RepID=A0A0E9UBA4_ANGAN